MKHSTTKPKHLFAFLPILLLLPLGNSGFGQTYKEITLAADSLYKAKGPGAAEPLFLQRVDVALKEFGDTSAQRLSALYDLCRMQYEQFKLDGLPDQFALIESILKKRNIELDPAVYGYYRARSVAATHASNFAEGLEWAEKAFDFAIKVWGEDALQTIGARNNVAFSMIRNHQYEEAKPILLDLKNKLEKTGNTAHRFYISVHFNLAEIYEFEGNASNAVKYFQTTQKFLENAKDRAGALEVQLRINYLKMNDLGDPVHIQKIYYDYLKACESVFGKNSYKFAKAQFYVAEILINQRTPKDAIPLIAEACIVIKEINGENSLEYAKCLNASGNAFYRSNDPESALLKHKQAFSIFEKLVTPTERDALFTLRFIIEDYINIGEKVARDSLIDIYAARSAGFKGTLSDQKSVLLSLAWMRWSQNNYEQCEQHAFEYKALTTPYDAGVSGQFRDYQSILYNLYTIWQKPEMAREALRNLIEATDHHAESRLFGFSESNRMTYLDYMRKIHDYALTAQYKSVPQAMDINELYNHLIKYKSLVFQSAESFKNALSTIRDTTVLNTLEQWRTSRQKLVQLSSLSKETLAKYDYNMNEIARETQMLEGALLEKSVELGKVLNLPKATWKDIQQALPPGAAAVDIVRFYHRTKRDDPYDQIMYAVFVIKQGAENPVLLFLDQGNEINSFQFERYQKDIQGGNTVSSSVYQAIWGKIDRHLSDVDHLYVAPDGIYHKINLATLRDPKGKYLFEKYKINVVHNLGALLFSAPKAVEQTPIACLVGNPRFDLGLPENPPGQEGTKKRDLLSNDYLPDSTTLLQPLPASALEVEDIAGLLKSKGYIIRVLLDTAATEANIVKVNRPSVLHIATHGHFLKSPKREKLLFDEEMTRDNPMLRSMLFFTGASNTIQGKPVPEYMGDGVFTALEAENLDLSETELVVLSACDTGLGIIENGEGVFGLQRAFRMAGARYVLISLWAVEDTQTRKFMNTFYKHWMEGQSDIPDAFHRTQADMFKAGMPVGQWGAFVLLGE